MTRQRMVICSIIKHSEKHLTASQVAQLAKNELGKIALATVYNNLNELVEEGVIGRLHLPNGADLYDKYPSAHAHLYCPKCKSVCDVPIGGFIPYLSEKTGKEIHSFQLIIEALCDDCVK